MRKLLIVEIKGNASKRQCDLLEETLDNLKRVPIVSIKWECMKQEDRK